MIITALSAQQVIASVSQNPIGERVARSADACVTGQLQVLEVLGQNKVDTGLDGIGALTRQFNDAVTAVINCIGVVSCSAEHAVRSLTTVELIVSSPTIKLVTRVFRPIKGVVTIAGNNSSTVVHDEFSDVIQSIWIDDTVIVDVTTVIDNVSAIAVFVGYNAATDQAHQDRGEL